MATYSATGSICKYYKMDLIVSESDVNNATNESTVNYELKLTSSGGYWFELIGSTVKITIDGEEVFNEYSKKDITANGTIPIKKGSKVVKHNANGSKTVNCKAEWTQSSTANYTPGKMTASGDLPLTDIPRASKITCADFNIGSSATVVVTKATNEFLHTVTYNIDGITGTIGDEYASTPTLGWNTEDIANDIYEKIPTATSIKGTLHCKTYNSSKVQVGETTETTFTAFVVNSNPTITIDSVVDVLAGSIAVTGSSQKLINGISNAQATVTAKSKNGAKIKNVKILTSDGRTFSSDRAGTETSISLAHVFSAVKNNADSFVFEAQVTDTRNLTNTEKVTLTKTVAAGTWVKYIMPAITGISAERENSTSSNVTLKVTANKWNGNFGKVENGTVLQWRYKEATSDSWANSYQPLSPTVNGNSLSYTGVLPVAFAYNKDYTIEVRLADSLAEDTLTVLVVRGIPIIDIGEHDVDVNGEIKRNGVPIVELLYPIGSIYMAVNDISPATIFGGTWERIKDRFLLSAGDSYANGSTGGEATHTLTSDEMPAHGHSIASSGAHKHTYQGYLQTSVSNSTTYLSISRKKISGDPEDTPASMVNNSGAHTHTAGNTGGGAAHNNMPPYLAVYMWKRTA